MWIAKNKDDGTIYLESKSNDIYKTQSWIDKNIDQDKERKKFIDKILNEKNINENDKDYELKRFALELSFIFVCNRVLCYNIEQNRFCDGFDF